MSKSYHQMGLVPVSKYDIKTLAFPRDTPIIDAVARFIERKKKKPVKAIVPMNYDMSLAEGSKIQIEPASTVSLVLLTDVNIVWANGSSERASDL